MTPTLSYREFLEAKRAHAPSLGVEGVTAGHVNGLLKPHQRDIALWAVRGGRRAIFANFGLGKTFMQLEAMRLMVDAETRNDARKGQIPRGLIVAPLGVRQEFLRDAEKLGIELSFIRSDDDLKTVGGFWSGGLYLTNYESVREGKLDPSNFCAVSLDEAAILRGFGGTKTFREFMRLFERTPYRFVATATPSPNQYIEILSYAAFLGIMDVGEAKAQPVSSKVLTPTGWKRMGDIRVGDYVIAGDGSPTRVVGVYPQGERPIWRVTFSDGSSTRCDPDHLWLTRSVYDRNNERRFRQRNPEAGATPQYEAVRTAREIAHTLRSGNHVIPLVEPVKFDHKPVAIDPWLLGLLLGDACMRETSIVLSTADEWVVTRVQERLPVPLWLRRTTPGGCDYSITATSRQGGNGPGSNHLLTALRSYGLLGKRAWEKSIPRDYLINDVATRLAVLQGLMDADGTVHKDGRMVRFCTTSPQLADEVQFLVRSLGGTAVIRERRTTGRIAHIISIKLPEGINPFALPRKANRVRAHRKYPPMRYIRDIEPAGVESAQCIAVEHPSRLYVTDDFIVTHNTRFFKRNSEKADQLTLHAHKETEFWLWVHSWAVFLQRPSELGYSDEGYDLPPLTVRWHSVPTPASVLPVAKDGQPLLLRDNLESGFGVQQAAAEKRGSLGPRIAKVREIVEASPDEHVIIWHDLEDERRAIEEAVPGVVSVYGSQDLDEREKRVADFADGKIARLAAKPVMLGSGCNLQRHCARAIYAGVGFKFNDFIQSIHRIRRYLQTREVVIDIVHAESEAGVVKRLQEKWQRHDAMMARMSEIVKQYGLHGLSSVDPLARTIGVERRVEAQWDDWRVPQDQPYEASRWTAVNNDCVEEMSTFEANTVDLIVTSIPFGTQYEYTPSYNDFGHTDDDAHFWAQMDYLSPHLLRALKPGRVMCVHVKDRIRPGGMDGLGFQTASPFHAEAILHYRRHGFAYVGMITVVTDVVRENNQTYRLGWTEQCKDGSRMGVGMPEYVLLFRKPPSDASDGYADERVVKSKADYSRARWQIDAHGFWRSSGNRLLAAEDLVGLPADEVFRLFRGWSYATTYDHEETAALGEALEAAKRLPSGFMLLQPQSTHPDVWTDVARMRTLNTTQAIKGREQHLCPMPLDIVKRLIVRYSNPGELVLDPFMGLGTVPLVAVENERRGHGIELNPFFFDEAVRHLRSARGTHVTLFDLIEAEEQFDEDGIEEVAS